MAQTLEFDRDEASTFLNNLFGPRASGFIALAFKVPEESIAARSDRKLNDYKRRDDTRNGIHFGSYGWVERRFAASERENMFAEIEERMAADPCKVMISPALFSKPNNRQAVNVKMTRVVHLDWDGKGKDMDPELFRKLRRARPMLVYSGTGHNFHAYIGVRGMDLDDHYKLAWALREKFGGDNKIAANDLLTIPSTLNIKDLNNPTRVQLLNQDQLKMWSCIEEVAEILGLDLDTVPDKANPVDVAEESLAGVSKSKLRRIRRICKEGQTDDMSDANFRVVHTCRENGLTPGQTFTFMRAYLEEDVDYKCRDNSWLIADIGRIWTKPGKNSPARKPKNAEVTEELPVLGERRLKLVKASTVKTRRTKWLWDNRIPVGALTLLGGREGTGKSTVTIDLAAKITRGELDGEYKGKPKSVFFVTTEDSYESTIVPRLKAANADLDRVIFLIVEIDEETDSLSLPEDNAELLNEIVANDVGLVILDPIKSSLGEGVDTEKERSLRRALEPINRLAAEGECAIVGIMHFNKRDAGDAGVMMSGLLVWSQVARATIGLIPHPDIRGEFILGNGKNNLAPAHIPCLHGKTVTVDYRDDYGDAATTSRVEWLGELDQSFADLMKPEAELKGRAKEIQTWLEELILERESIAATEAIELAHSRGFRRDKDVRAAAQRLNVRHTRVGFGKGSKVYWSFVKPAAEKPAPGNAKSNPVVMEQITNMLSIQSRKLFSLRDIADELGGDRRVIKTSVEQLIRDGFLEVERVGQYAKVKFKKMYHS